MVVILVRFLVRILIELSNRKFLEFRLDWILKHWIKQDIRIQEKLAGTLDSSIGPHRILQIYKGHDILLNNKFFSHSYYVNEITIKMRPIWHHSEDEWMNSLSKWIPNKFSFTEGNIHKIIPNIWGFFYVIKLKNLFRNKKSSSYHTNWPSLARAWPNPRVWPT